MTKRNWPLKKIGFSILSVLLSASTFVANYSPATTIQTEEIQIVKPLHVLPRTYMCVEHEDCRYLAQAIYYESRGEPIEGQVAVAWVVMNRTYSDSFPNTVHGVVSANHQFSYYPSVKKFGYENFPSYKTALSVAKNVILGYEPDPTDGSTYYLNPKKVKHLPKWTRKFERTVKIGSHVFYKDEN